MVADTQSMRELRQWLVWRSEERDGKQTKIPYSPATGQRASSTAPETWAGYEVELQRFGGRFFATPQQPPSP